MAVGEGSGEGHRGLLRSLDYPCTKALRLRRLHAWYSHWAVYDAMKQNTTVVFHVKDMMNPIKAGNWRKASSYLHGFLLFHRPISDEASLLELFLRYLMTLDDFADGKTIVTCVISDWVLSIYRHPVLAKYPCFATFVADVLFQRSDHAKYSFRGFWQLVRKKAAAMAEEMVRKTPELMGRLHSPPGPKDPCHVVPIGSGFHRRRHVRMACRQQPTDLARFYLQMKRRMPSLNQRTALDDSATSGEPLMALLDKALQAGRRPEVEQVGYPEYLSRGFPLVQMLNRFPFFPKFYQGPLPEEHLQKQGTSQNPAEHAAPNHPN